MAEAYPYETRINARGHYVIDGMTYEQVADVAGVSVSQLKKWGVDEGWVARRKEYREAQASIEESTILLRAELLKNALSTKAAQDVYAVAAMEKLAVAMGKVKPVQMPVTVPDMSFSDPEEMVDELWKAIEFKAAGMISSPETMDLKQIEAGIRTWGNLKKQYTKKTDKPQQAKELDEHAKQTIKDIYGISK
jgi:uncharacterized protein YjcR